jgi:hypothetical protein
MRTICFTLILTVASIPALAQNNALLLKHDTIKLSSENANWLLPPAFKSKGKTVGDYFLNAIEKGKLKAFDPETGKPIPANKILTWNMPVDTVMKYDLNGDNIGMEIRQQVIGAEKFTKITIMQDLYLDPLSSKIFNRINYIDLLIEVQNYSGGVMGFRPFCRIKY